MIVPHKAASKEPRSPERRGEEVRWLYPNAEQLVTGKRLRQQMHLGGEDGGGGVGRGGEVERAVS